MKKLLSILLIFALTFSFFACSKKPAAEGTRTRIKMKVHVTYGGFGVTGKDLGHGTCDYVVRDVREGDIFQEEYGNKEFKRLTLKSKDDSADYIIEVVDISEDSIKITSHQSDLDLSFDQEQHISSGIVVYDGTNYDYTVTFTKEAA
ncbi:MAG: hypothetical protein J6U54_05075 [Clostridiales bacterium]|nr:hypothetical protein [Clostridiales bacterium]